MPEKPATIAVSNQKGGVGKSAVAINVAGALADRGHEVLFVDTDPQGNATEAWGAAEAYEKEPPNLFTVLTEPTDREQITDLVVDVGEVDLLPSNIDMTAIEPELTMSRRGPEQLDLALEHVTDGYDYVLIDCPPNLGNMVDNAIYAAENILVPALAESTSQRAFELLEDHIFALEMDYEDEGLNVQNRGVIVNRIDVRKNQAHEMIDWIETAYDDTPVWRVRERAAIQNAIDENVSLLAHDPEADMCDVFREIAEDLDRQFGFVGVPA